MGLLGKVVFLQKLRVELVEKRKKVSNDNQVGEIEKQIRKIDMEIQSIRRSAK